MKYIYIFFFCIGLTLNAQISKYPPAEKGEFEIYISRSEIEFKVGDTLEIGLPANGDKYLFITQGNQPAGTVLTGALITIEKLKSFGSKKKGYKMYAMFKGYGMIPVAIDIESAIRVDEILLQ